MKIDVPVVNAFTSDGKGGNPAGVVVDASNLSQEQMQYIAGEVGASETAFVLREENSVRVRFFTPTVEVPLCGHATIATWAYMLSLGTVTTGKHTQDTLAGVINVEVKNDMIFMEQPEQAFGMSLGLKVITDELGIPDEWIDKTFTPQIVQGALLLALTSKNRLNEYVLDKEKLIRLNKTYAFYGLHLFVMLDDSDTLAAVRDFDPIVGIDEDAATGTTNGSFLTYLKHHDRLPSREVYKIEQGEAMGQFSAIYGKFRGDRIWIGGQAIQSRMLHLNLA